MTPGHPGTTKTNGANMIIVQHAGTLTLMLLIWPIQSDAKILKNDRNPGIWVLI